MQNSFESKFDFIEGFKTAFSVFGNTQGQSLNYEFDFLGAHYQIDFLWYEPYRLSIRSGVGALFYVMAGLKVLSNFLHAFGVELGKASDSSVSGDK